MGRAREVLRDLCLRSSLSTSPAPTAPISPYSIFLCPSAVSSLLDLRLLPPSQTVSSWSSQLSESDHQNQASTLATDACSFAFPAQLNSSPSFRRLADLLVNKGLLGAHLGLFNRLFFASSFEGLNQDSAPDGRNKCLLLYTSLPTNFPEGSLRYWQEPFPLSADTFRLYPVTPRIVEE